MQKFRHFECFFSFYQLAFAESQVGEHQVQAGQQPATARMSTWKSRYLQIWFNICGIFFKNATFRNNKSKSAKYDNDLVLGQ